MPDMFTISCRMGRIRASEEGADRSAPTTVAGYKGERIKRIRRKKDVKNGTNFCGNGRKEHSD